MDAGLFGAKTENLCISGRMTRLKNQHLDIISRWKRRQFLFSFSFSFFNFVSCCGKGRNIPFTLVSKMNIFQVKLLTGVSLCLFFCGFVHQSADFVQSIVEIFSDYFSPPAGAAVDD